MARLLVHILVYVFVACISLTAYPAPNPVLLEQLDDMIGRRHLYEADRRAAIIKARTDFERADNDADRYNTLRGLYEAYRSYRIDSAIIVADRRLEIARTLGVPSKIASASLNLAEGYAKSGAADAAIAILDTLPSESLEDYHLKYRNSIYRKAYEMKASTALLGRDRVEALEKMRAYRDDAPNSDKSSRGHYTMEAEKLRDAGLYDEAVAKMEEANRLFDFSDDAAMQYTMGEMYVAAGRLSDAVDCLARSAMIDVSSGTKEYRSLILLASLLFEDGQVDRAFEYINCAFEDADFSNANLRTAEIMKSMPVIDRAFHDANREIAERTEKFLALAAVLVVLLLLSLIFAIMAFRSKRAMLATIEDINGRLEARNADLVEADSLKLRHINSLMLAYAGHISRLKDFRKTVYRLMKTSQYDKALDAVKSDKAEARDIAAFHEMFDEAFLSMFPTFVDDVNGFMTTPIVLKTEGRLTPELRVAAMMKLGMTSTDEIAGLLHYSPQTVYNLRSSIRGMLRGTWDDFEAYLREG